MYKRIGFSLAVFFSVMTALAQDTTIIHQDTILSDTVKKPEVVARQPIPLGNFIKVNLMGIPLRNFSLQYERVLSKRFTVSLGLRIMPEGSLPLLSTIEKGVDNNDPDFLSFIRSVNIKNTAITPELRWYPGKKGYGRGFYIAAYYRYVKADVKSSKRFEVEIDNIKRNISLDAKLTLHNMGLMLGAQWMLSKRIFIDWWIIGAQAGFQRGELNAAPDVDFTDEQIAEINNDISINFDALGQTTQINKKGVNIKTNSFLPYTGFRTGLCLGIRF